MSTHAKVFSNLVAWKFIMSCSSRSPATRDRVFQSGSDMGWAQKLPSGRYSGLYRDAEGKTRRVRGTFAKKSVAERKATAAEDVIRERKYHPPEQMTWNEWLPRWMLRRVVDEGTQKIDNHRINKHLVPKWGTVLLEDITQPDVQDVDLRTPKNDGPHFS